MLDLGRIRALLDERRPGHTLPQAFYTDADIFEFDLAAIHARSWIMAGFEVELPRPGSTFAFKVGRSPVVLVRGRDGVLRGFHNSCRHRGAQVCADGARHSARLVCPYHQWAYDLDGRLLLAQRMHEGFDPAAHGLRPVHVETAAGCIYVCLADAAPDFAPFRDTIEAMLAPHDLLNAKVAHQCTLVERGNWKLAMENARECYHCAVRHPELAVTFPVRAKKHFESGGDLRIEAFNARMDALGLPVGPVEGDWWQAARFPLNEGTTSMTMDGKPSCARLMCETGGGDVGSMRWALEPHMFAHAVGDHLFSFSAMPTAPHETVVTAKWLVHKDAEEGRDYDVAHLAELWDRTNRQDLELVEMNQRGVFSSGYVPGPYSNEAEVLTQRFVNWYCRTARGYLDANA